jgi:hypothetical protein
VSSLRRRDFLGGALASTGVAAFARPLAGRNCILLVLTGGPSQLDTFDMKPDAPSAIRGPFRPIRTNVPGIEISEIFPRMAGHADKYALIRSVYSDIAPVHEDGLSAIDAATDGWVTLPGPIGFMGCRAAAERTCVPQSFAANCRRAVQLVGNGVPFVRVNMFDTVFNRTTWDCHGTRPFSTIRDYKECVGPEFDLAYTGLLEELGRLDLLERTLVVAIGEFGRTPHINPSGGRDHWAKCQTIVIAGGGIRGGEVYGSSDATGAEPKENPVSMTSILASLSMQNAAFTI